MIDGWLIFWEFALRWMSLDFTNDVNFGLRIGLTPLSNKQLHEPMFTINYLIKKIAISDMLVSRSSPNYQQHHMAKLRSNELTTWGLCGMCFVVYSFLLLPIKLNRIKSNDNC